MRNKNRSLLLLWIILSFLGILLIVPEDSAETLIQLSNTHGPSQADAIGLILILLGAILQWTYVGMNMRVFSEATSMTYKILLVTLGLSGAFLTFWSISGDVGRWWLFGVGMLVFAFGLFAAKVETWSPS